MLGYIEDCDVDSPLGCSSLVVMGQAWCRRFTVPVHELAPGKSRAVAPVEFEE